MIQKLTSPNFDSMAIEVFVAKDMYQEGVVMPRQRHTTNVGLVTAPREVFDGYDALVTNLPGIRIGVHTADCAPICISDGKHIGVAHVGWRGLCAGMIEIFLSHFHAPYEVYVGPHLHTFEVQKDFCYDAIIAKFGEGGFLTPHGESYLFDFKSAIASLLPAHTVIDERNTETDTSLPSYRHKRMFGHLITTVRITGGNTQS